MSDVEEFKQRLAESLFNHFGIRWGGISPVQIDLSFRFNDNSEPKLEITAARREGGGGVSRDTISLGGDE